MLRQVEVLDRERTVVAELVEPTEHCREVDVAFTRRDLRPGRAARSRSCTCRGERQQLVEVAAPRDDVTGVDQEPTPGTESTSACTWSIELHRRTRHGSHTRPAPRSTNAPSDPRRPSPGGRRRGRAPRGLRPRERRSGSRPAARGRRRCRPRAARRCARTRRHGRARPRRVTSGSVAYARSATPIGNVTSRPGFGRAPPQVLERPGERRGGRRAETTAQVLVECLVVHRVRPAEPAAPGTGERDHGAPTVIRVDVPLHHPVGFRPLYEAAQAGLAVPHAHQLGEVADAHPATGLVQVRERRSTSPSRSRRRARVR